jgi:hypothetical protein
MPTLSHIIYSLLYGRFLLIARLFPPQKRRNPLLDKYFMLASYLGDTGVYVVLLPWFYWYLDPHLGRLYMWLLFIGTCAPVAAPLTRPRHDCR